MTDKQNSAQWAQGISGIGAGISTYAAGANQIAGGEAQQAAYAYNAKAVMDQTKEEAVATQAKYSALSGRERSLYAKAGVSISSGSPLLIAMHMAEQAQGEISSIQEAGRAKAKILQYYGNLAAWSGKVAGETTWLTGLSKISNSFQTSQ